MTELTSLVQDLLTCADAHLTAEDRGLAPLPGAGGAQSHELTEDGVVLHFRGRRVRVRVTPED